MTSLRNAATAVLCMMLIPALASAQGISGTVIDTSGGVVPGVTVEARSPALIEQLRTAVTDGAGLYSIVQLPHQRRRVVGGSLYP